MDISNSIEHSEAIIELVSILDKFKRPIVLILNKCDNLSYDINDQARLYSELNLEKLMEENPGLTVLPYIALSDRSLGILKDWLGSMFKLYGIKQRTKVLQPKKKKGSWLLCYGCGGDKPNKNKKFLKKM